MLRVSWPVQLDVDNWKTSQNTVNQQIPSRKNFRISTLKQILNESQNKRVDLLPMDGFILQRWKPQFSRIRVVEKLLILVQSFCLVLLWLRVNRPNPFFEPFKISFFGERFLMDSEFSRSNWIKNSRSESLFKSL